MENSTLPKQGSVSSHKHVSRNGHVWPWNPVEKNNYHLSAFHTWSQPPTVQTATHCQTNPPATESASTTIPIDSTKPNEDLKHLCHRRHCLEKDNATHRPRCQTRPRSQIYRPVWDNGHLWLHRYSWLPPGQIHSPCANSHRSIKAILQYNGPTSRPSMGQYTANLPKYTKGSRCQPHEKEIKGQHRAIRHRGSN